MVRSTSFVTSFAAAITLPSTPERKFDTKETVQTSALGKLPEEIQQKIFLHSAAKWAQTHQRAFRIAQPTLLSKQLTAKVQEINTSNDLAILLGAKDKPNTILSLPFSLQIQPLATLADCAETLLLHERIKAADILSAVIEEMPAEQKAQLAETGHQLQRMKVFAQVRNVTTMNDFSTMLMIINTSSSENQQLCVEQLTELSFRIKSLPEITQQNAITDFCKVLSAFHSNPSSELSEIATALRETPPNLQVIAILDWTSAAIFSNDGGRTFKQLT